MEELTLDVSFEGGPIQRFTSGLRPVGAAFPEIDVRISLHNEFCMDSVLAVDAKPIGVTGVAGGSVRSSLTVSPNPCLAAVDVGFVLRHEGTVELGVFDLAGRRVASIVPRQRLAAGPHERVWNGQGEDGVAVPPGIYAVRMDGPEGRTVRTLAKLR